MDTFSLDPNCGEDAKSKINDIQNFYLFLKGTGGLKHSKIKLNNMCHTFFETNVLKFGGPPIDVTIKGHRLLQEANKLFDEYLLDKDFPQLLKIEGCITRRLKFNKCEITLGKAGLIFETMNNRGIALTSLDRLKNYLMYLAEIACSNNTADLTLIINTINVAWGSILPNLEVVFSRRIRDADEEQFVRFALFIIYGRQLYERSEWDSYRVVKAIITLNAPNGVCADIQTIVGNLTLFSEIYKCLYLPYSSHTFTLIQKEYLEKLKRLERQAPFWPLLMCFWYKFRGDFDFNTNFEELLKLCEIFCFRVWYVAGYNNNKNVGRLHDLAYELFSGNIASAADLISRLKADIRWLCSDLDFDNRLRNKEYGWRGVDYFFYERELYLIGMALPAMKISWDEASSNDSIEHILPQTETPYWTGIFGMPAHGTVGATISDYDKYLHRISNLTLTLNNPALGNKNYGDKCTIYSSGSTNPALSVEKEIPTLYTDWNQINADKRMEDLISWALGRWAI